MLDSNRLDGKVALITGAAGEIGAATVKLMIARGARIVAVDRDKAALMRLSDELERPAEVISIEGDVTDEGSVAGFVARARVRWPNRYLLQQCRDRGVGPSDCGISTRRLSPRARRERRGRLSWIETRPSGHRGCGRGAVINSSSVAGPTGTAGLCAYNASKHAVIGLTRSAAAEWGGRGIRVNSVNPGPIATRMMSSLEEGLSPGRAAKARERFSAMIPALRYGTPEEVAALVAFLASEDARYIHGAVFVIDGGFTVS